MTQASSILRVDRVRESATVSSIGTYNLTGANVGYRTFSANIPDGSIIDYGVTQTAGASWENGVGVYHSDTNTVTVTSVTSSSNANNPITWTGQSITIFVSLNAASVTEIQNSSFVYSIMFG
jgi:hypothetical protein